MKENICWPYAISIFFIAIFFGCMSENQLVKSQFKEGKSRLLVCPVHVLENQNCKYDSLISQKIVDYINEKKYANAELTSLIPVANNRWRHNEAKILRESISLFVDFVKESNLPDNTFILYPEFLIAGKNLNVVAVHYCLLNNKGELAMIGLINSHWKEYQAVNPKNRDDALQVFINGFENKMAEK